MRHTYKYAESYKSPEPPNPSRCFLSRCQPRYHIYLGETFSLVSPPRAQEPHLLQRAQGTKQVACLGNINGFREAKSSSPWKEFISNRGGKIVHNWALWKVHFLASIPKHSWLSLTLPMPEWAWPIFTTTGNVGSVSWKQRRKEWIG